MNTDKIIGYGLLIAGLGVIVYAIHSMFNVFTGAAAAPAVFNMNSVAVPLPMGEGMPVKEIELISGAEASKVVNMGLWAVFMTFLLSAGGKIGGLGVNLIRDIKLK